MPRAAGSLTLFLALVLTLSGCSGPPRPHIAGYQLDTELPHGLPDQAPIYRVVEAPTPGAEWARHVAAALGFEGEPVAYSEDAAELQWTWGKAYSSEALTVYGNIAFQCSDPPDGDTGVDNLETKEQAVAAAQAWSYRTAPAESRLTR